MSELNTPSRVIFLTGASRGIGAELARGLLGDGHRLIATARDPASLTWLKEEAVRLEATERLLTCALDVSDLGSVTEAARLAQERFGVVEVIINNAGVAESAPLHKTSDELWSHTMQVNLTGPFWVTRALLPALRGRAYGRVIFIASIAGLTGSAYTSAYCASKHGVVGMTRSLALELASSGVTANAICPGFVDTDMAMSAVEKISTSTGRDAQEARAALEAFSPQRRLIQPSEVLHLTRFLIHDASRGVNGQALTIDGGQVQH